MSWLLITSAWPWPVRRGVQVRTLQLAEMLAAREPVTVLCPEPHGDAAPLPPSRGFEVATFPLPPSARLGGLVRAALAGHALQSGLFAGRALERAVREHAERADRVLVQTTRFAALRSLPARERLVFDLIDSLSLNFDARARTDRPWLRPIWRLEARRLARDESRAIDASSAGLVVCERDRRHMMSGLGTAAGARLGVVPLQLRGGAAPAREGERAAGKPATLLLTGNLGYFPTRHGLVWFLQEVWPELRGPGRAGPAMRLVVAGSRPPASVGRQLRDAGAELVSEPTDFAPLFAEADLALAPLFAGSGTPMKLLEAVAAGVPVLATGYAAAGVDETIAGNLERADDAAGWVSAILRMTANPAACRERAAAARRQALELYSPARVAAQFRRVVG